MRRFSFRPSQRIQRRSDFEKVYSARQRIDAGDFVIYYRANGRDYDRLGLSVAAKNIGGAVRRNRAKRILRELFRLMEDRVTPEVAEESGATAVDLVVSPRASLLDAEHSVLVRRWLDAVKKIRARLSGK